MQEDVGDKVREYLDAGARLVWIADTSFSIVIVHRPDARPQLFTVDQEITAEPFLPGFVAPVAEFFEDIES
jgi:Uma2 family endonuclease